MAHGTTNKMKLVKKTSDDLGVDHHDVNYIVDAFLKNLTDSLRSGIAVRIAEFGTIDIVTRRSKTGFNINKKEIVNTPIRYGIKYRPYVKIVEQVRSLEVTELDMEKSDRKYNKRMEDMKRYNLKKYSKK